MDTARCDDETYLAPVHAEELTDTGIPLTPVVAGFVERVALELDSFLCSSDDEITIKA